MSTPVTSPVGLPAGPGHLTEQWADFFRFLRRPQLPEKASGFSGKALAATLRILALDILITVALILMFIVLTMLGIEPPPNIMEDLEFTPGIIALIVLAAPIGEELVFRSWLSGRPGHVLALVLLAACALGVPFFYGLSAGGAADSTMAITIGGVGLVVGLILAGGVLYLFRNRGPWRWFAKIFPVMLLLSAASFAFVHVFNYQGEPNALVYIFVLPQFILGLVCAYARVNFGLWSNTLIHALHNGTAVALIMMFPDLG